jgi:hypothetical protein
LLELHKKVHETPQLRKSKVEKGNDSNLVLGSEDEQELEEFISAITPMDENQPSRSLPERNLENYMEQIKKMIPMDEIPIHESKKAWKGQIQTTKRALDERLWNQRVQTQKALRQIDNMNPLDFVIGDIRDSKRVKARKEELIALQVSKRNIHDQYRRIKQMQARQEKSQDMVKRQQKREKLKQEQVSLSYISCLVGCWMSI